MAKEIKNNKIRELMSTAMNDLGEMADVNTIIGKPIMTDDGTTLIPVCKVTMGFMTGGGEYGEIKQFKNGKEVPFAGGSGAVISMKPIGFLSSGTKGIKLINTEKDAYTKLFETAEEIISKLKK